MLNGLTVLFFFFFFGGNMSVAKGKFLFYAFIMNNKILSFCLNRAKLKVSWSFKRFHPHPQAWLHVPNCLSLCSKPIMPLSCGDLSLTVPASLLACSDQSPQLQSSRVSLPFQSAGSLCSEGSSEVSLPSECEVCWGRFWSKPSASEFTYCISLQRYYFVQRVSLRFC